MERPNKIPSICAVSGQYGITGNNEVEDVSLPSIMKEIAYAIIAGSTTAWMTANPP